MIAIHTKKSRQTINQWLENGTCCDTYRDIHPNKVGYTWHTKNLKKQARLDYILTSPQLISKVKEIKNVPQTSIERALFSTRLAFEENVKRLQQNEWKTDNEIYFLQSTVARLLSTEPTSEEMSKMPKSIT